jgi:hypothetical protein
MAIRPISNRSRQFSLSQMFGVLTAFAVAYGLWHTNSFEFVVASAVALGVSSIILLRSKREQLAILLQGIVCLSMGLAAAALYAAEWGEERKLVQIGVAIATALCCWLLINLVTWMLTQKSKRAAIQDK